METKYGRSVVDDLEATAGPKKWTREELQELKNRYRSKIKDLQNGIAPPSASISVLSMFGDISGLNSMLRPIHTGLRTAGTN
jgi:hypothetical protein